MAATNNVARTRHPHRAAEGFQRSRESEARLKLYREKKPFRENK